MPSNGNKVTYNYTTPVQNIDLSLIWRFSGGQSINVNAVENGSQSFKEDGDRYPTITSNTSKVTRLQCYMMQAGFIVFDISVP